MGKIKEFKPLSYFTHYGLCYNLKDVDSFEAEIDENASLEELVSEVISEIKNVEIKGIRIFDYASRIPYDNKVIDEKNKVAAFVLLRETMLVGGMNWKEAIYGIRVKGKKLEGTKIAYNHGYSVNDAFGHQGCNEGSRLMVIKIENGILKYVLKTKDGTYERECDLKKL